MPEFFLVAGVGVLASGVLAAAGGFAAYERLDPWSAAPGHSTTPVVTLPTAAPVATPVPVATAPFTLPAIVSAVNRTGPVVTPDEAGALVGAWWPVHERALVTNNITATDQLETGALALYTNGATRDLAGRGLEWRTVRPLLDTRVIVPRQNAYPASFLAIVETTVYATNRSYAPGTKTIEFIVFARSSAADTWKAALRWDGILRGWPPALVPAVAGSGPYAAPPHGPFVAEAQALPELLAAYWTASRSSGAPPAGSPFASAVFTNMRGDQLYQDQHDWQVRTGLRGDVVYFSDPADPVFQFAVNPDDDLACFTVRMHSVTERAGTGMLHQDASRANYGGRLPPGDYPGLLAEGMHQTCVQVPSRARGGQLLVDGVSGGDYAEVPEWGR